MIINWFGQSCFKIAGEKNVLVCDPFSDGSGLKLPRLAADVVTVSHQHPENNNTKAVKGITSPLPFIIDGPGEYEVNDIFVYGIAAFHDNKEGKDLGENIIYRIEIDGISIAHLGHLGHLLDNGLTEKLEGVDILIIPVGGGEAINAKQATEIISQLEPRIVIPMSYQLPGLKTKEKLENINAFCKEIGVCPKEVLTKFKISKKDLPQQDLQVVVLEP